MENIIGKHTMIGQKINAAVEYFEVERDEVEPESGKNFTVEGVEYMILTEDERDEELKDYISDTVWAFNPEFLADMTELDVIIFEALTEKYEDGNNAILKLIEKTCGLEEFISEAVRYDGAGHFLSPYDGVEHELWQGETLFYAYRV